MSRLKLDKDKILKKFRSLSMTAICIQKTSKYMFQFYKSSDTIVSIWQQALSTASDQLKISLFYIANEMLQSRNYGSSNFKQSWKPFLAQSLDFVKNSSVIDKVIRILNIWIERRVYDQIFVEELINKLASARSPVINEDDAKNIILNFEPEDAIEKLRNLVKIESTVTETMKNIDFNTLNFDEKSFKDSIKKLKDKIHCNEFSNQLDSTIKQLFQVCSIFEEELKVRKKTLKIMENADIYYQTQLRETLIVEDAYKRYGNLISKTKESLEEHLDFLIDDAGPLDIDDAPSPGKTPPYLYETVKPVSQLNNSPMSFQDVVSPTQSMDMSEEDTPMDAANYHDKPYSPSNEVSSRIDIKTNSSIAPVSHTSTISTVSSTEESKVSLSCSDALKILTSVFSQSLTKKASNEFESRIQLQPDIFRNTLTTSSVANESSDNNNNISSSNSSTSNTGVTKAESSSESVVADAFRLISNLTGIKNIGERNYKSDTTTTALTCSGTTIPILTSKTLYRSVSIEPENLRPNLFAFNQPTYSSVNVGGSKCDNLPHTLFPDVPSSFPPPMYNPQPVNTNPIFPLLSNHAAISSQPPPTAMFNPLTQNPLAFNIDVMNKDSTQTSNKSPGSCTEDEDEGGATPTQDEPISHQGQASIFTQNSLPVLHPSAEEINKQIQNVMNATANSFTMPNILSGPGDPGSSNMGLQPTPWNHLANQFPFNLKSPNIPTQMNMPFSLNNQNCLNQSGFSTVTNSKTNIGYGPPRAVRIKQPNNQDSSTGNGNQTINSLTGVGGGGSSTIDFTITPPPPPPPKSSETITMAVNANSRQEDQQQSMNQGDTNHSKNHDKELELLNLYGDVEEELDRNYNFNNQQNINVRNTRPPPPSDRYHLYNQSAPGNMNYRFNDSMNNVIPRMNYQHSPSFNSYHRNQFPRTAMYYPNRTTNFRPRQNFNMFN